MDRKAYEESAELWQSFTAIEAARDIVCDARDHRDMPPEARSDLQTSLEFLRSARKLIVSRLEEIEKGV